MPNRTAEIILHPEPLAPPHSPPTSRAGKRIFDLRLLAVSSAGFCVFLSVYATQTLLPLLKKLYHATEERASMTVTATTIAVAVAAPWIGLLAERIGRKRVIVWAIFLLAVPTFLAATAVSLDQLIFWRFVQGLIMPGIIAVTMAYVAEQWPAESVGTAMSAYVTGNVLAGVIGRLMTGWIGQHFGWPEAFIALGALDLIGGVIVWRGLPSPRLIPGMRRPPWSDAMAEIHHHLRNGQLLASFTVGFCILLALVGTFTYVTFRLAGAPFHLSPSQLGYVFLVYLLGVVVTPISGPWIDRFGQRTAVIVAMIAAVAGILLTLLPSLPATVIGLAICSSAVFVSQSATASFMGLAAGDHRASAAGLYASFYYLGGASGAVVPGLLWRFGGWDAAVVFIAIVFAMAGGVAAMIWKPRDSIG